MIRKFVQKELGWDNVRWELEIKGYQDLWNSSYSPV